MTARRLLLPGLGFLTLMLVEGGFLAHQYAVRGTIWHYLLHSTIGAGLGLAAAGLYAAARDRRVNPWPWALLGQLVSITPDLLFVLDRMPHDRWMDAFLGHLSIHTGPQPLLVGSGIFLVGGWAWAIAAVLRRRVVGALLGLATAGLLAGALAAHIPLPTHLSDYMTRYGYPAAAPTPPAPERPGG